MKAFFKILLLLIAIFPVWLTIIAFADPIQPSHKWKDILNSKLLAQNSEAKRLQIVELGSSTDDFNEAYLTEEFSLNFIDQKAKGFSTIELSFNDSEGRLNRILRVVAKLKIEEKVLLASRDINRGDRIQDDDLTSEWRDASTLNGSPLSKDQILGRVIRNPVKAGRPIYNQNIEIENLVKLGDRVRVLVSGNGVRITSFGIAKQSGQMGETIRILNPESKREIYGTITAQQVVEVRI